MERERTRGSYYDRNDKASYWWNTSQSPKPAPSISRWPDAFGEVEYMRDSVTPGFHKRSNSGEVFCNAMFKRREYRSFSSTGPSFVHTAQNGVSYYGELLGGPWGIVPDWSLLSVRQPPDLRWLYDQTRTRALANVKPPDYAGLVALGELRETLSYLRNPLKTGLKLAKALDGKARRVVMQNGRHVVIQPPPEGSKAWLELQNLYMEFRYGVRPLVKDISALADTISFGVKKRHVRETYRAKGENSYSDSWSKRLNFYGSEYAYDANFKYKRDTVVRAGLLYELSHGVDGAVDWGMRLDQLPIATWQLLPLSFVWDWFLNVGQFIQALIPVAGSTRLAEWVVTRIEEEFSIEKDGWSFSHPEYSRFKDGGGADIIKRLTVKREPLVGAPSIVLDRNSLPSLLDDKARILDLVTLTLQALRLPVLVSPGGHQNIGPVKRWRGTGD